MKVVVNTGPLEHIENLKMTFLLLADKVKMNPVHKTYHSSLNIGESRDGSSMRTLCVHKELFCNMTARLRFPGVLLMIIYTSSAN